MTGARRWELGRRPGLDGIRALAVVAVVGVHLTTILVPSLATQWFIGGVIGVDVFFVLSGFLISSLLLEEHRRCGRISLRAFWRRRALRLFPALYVLMAADFVFVAATNGPLRYTLKGDSLIVAYVSNWSWAFNWPMPFGMGNTWSLGVEEQFYVVWPILLIGLLWTRRTWLVPCVAVGIGLASWADHWHLAKTATMWTQPIAETQAHLSTLMVGVILAWALHAGWRAPLRWARYMALPAVGFLTWVVQTNGAPVGFYDAVIPLSGVATAILILALLEPRGVAYWIIGSPPLRWLGRVSYSLYLWHEFVFAATYQLYPNSSPWLRGAAGLGVSVVAATASYYLIERPLVAVAHRQNSGTAGVQSSAAAIPTRPSG